MRSGLRRNILLGTAAVFVLVASGVVADGAELQDPTPAAALYVVAPDTGADAPQSSDNNTVASSDATEVATATPTLVIPPPSALPTNLAYDNYIEIVNSCDYDWAGGCVQARSKPTASSTSIMQLRTGMVLAVASTTYTDAEGNTWYRVVFNEWLRYPDRLPQPIYVSADYANPLSEPEETTPVATTTKRIIVKLSEQKLYAYDGDTLFMEAPVSTGLQDTPTPRGDFTVYKKTPSRYMQGPIPGISNQEYDLPGVPWDLYFTPEGGAIHGAYWHNHFGEEWSHGCVNLPLDQAEQLYDWAPLGTPVIVED